MALAPKDYGRYLPRGGRKIEVDKAADTFTLGLSPAKAAARLGEEGSVESIEPVTETVTRVKVRPDPDQPVEERRDRLMADLRTSHEAVVHHEYVEALESKEHYQITDEIIVSFRPDVPKTRLAEILETEGVVVKKQYEQLGHTYLVKVTDAAQANPLKVANRLEAYSEVEYAEPSIVNRFRQQSFPLDDLFTSQWHLYSKDQVAPDIDPHADAMVFEAWQHTKGSRDVVVAVLDDGFELTHPDFRGPEKIVRPTDFVGNDENPMPDRWDYHGTACAGVAIAEENGEGCVGVAPNCAFMPVRFPLNAPDPWLIEIFNYVSQHAHIASCSWGMIPGDFGLHTAVNATLSNLARQGGKDGKGLVIVFAAGNYDAPINAEVDYHVRWLGQDHFGNPVMSEATGRIVNGFPAHPDTIAVSACTSLNRKAFYSNWGNEISVAAPSNNFDHTSLTPLPGRGITTTDNEEFGDDFTPGKRYTNSFGGTSSATPLVAGVAALLKSANPHLTALEIKAILEATANKIEDPSADPLYGHKKGSYKDGHSEWFGFGKVDALRAVEEATRRTPAQSTVEIENTTAYPIPDYPGRAVYSTLEVDLTGTISDVTVSLVIDHTWIGDLIVYLVSPQGDRIYLHNRAGFRQQNLRTTYTAANRPSLGQLQGQQAQGTWTLAVVDRARRDTGILQQWQLKIDLLTSPESVVRLNGVDDLEEVDGIGPTFASRLADHDVQTFEALAALTDPELEAIIRPRSFQKLDFASWRRQAQELMGRQLRQD